MKKSAIVKIINKYNNQSQFILLNEACYGLTIGKTKNAIVLLKAKLIQLSDILYFIENEFNNIYNDVDKSNALHNYLKLTCR